MRTIWLNRDEAEFPAGRPGPDATIGPLAQLFDVLSEPYTRGLWRCGTSCARRWTGARGHFIASDDAAAGAEREQ